MSDILDAYFEEGIGEVGQTASARQVKTREIDRQLSARDHEKAAARNIFRAGPDWQNSDKINRFLRVTKDLKR